MAEASAYRGESKTAVAEGAVFKSIELTGESKKGWSEAIAVCISQAAETIEGITDVQVEEMRGKVRDGSIASYLVRCKVLFRVDSKLRSH